MLDVNRTLKLYFILSENKKRNYYYYYGQPKIHKPRVPIRLIVLYSGFPLYNLNKWFTNILKAQMFKMKITTPRILTRFPITSEMFPLNMMRYTFI